MSAVPETAAPGVSPAFDVAAIRREFPILAREVHGRPLVYLDNANTTQKPRAVIEAERRYYEETNANIHRGTHFLSEKATAEYEGARAKVARFLGAARAAGGRLHARHDGGDQPRRGRFRELGPEGGRRDSPHGPRAPLEHRALAARLRPHGREARRRPDHRLGRGARSRSSRSACRTGRGSPPSRTSRTRSAPSTPSRSSSVSRTRGTCRSSWTARRPRRTSRSTSPRSAATSTRSPATRCTARPASARSTARRRGSRSCRRTRAAAT